MKLVDLNEAKYEMPEVLTLVGDFYYADFRTKDDKFAKKNVMVKVRIIDEDNVGQGRSKPDQNRANFWVRVEDQSPDIKHYAYTGHECVLHWKSGNNWALFPTSDEEYWSIEKGHV